MSSDLEHWNIDATVYRDRVEEIHVVNDPARNIRGHRQKHVWHVREFLGRGGFGEVRLQHNLETRKARAVKRIVTIGTVMSKSECEKELEALMEFSKPKFKQAACFVEFYGWFSDSEEMFLAMEFMELGDLEKNVRARNGRLPEVEARDITAQILQALEIMHALNFAHRDLKPQNVMVVAAPPRRWWVKLADFGLSKRLTDATGYSTRSGTRDYMAPEMLGYLKPDKPSAHYTSAVDIWATGCIVYRLLTGAVPFPEGPLLTNYCNDSSLFPYDQLVVNGVGRSIVAFLEDVLATTPQKRPSTFQALQHMWIRTGSSGGDKSPSLMSEVSEPVGDSSVSYTTSGAIVDATLQDELMSDIEKSLMTMFHPAEPIFTPIPRNALVATPPNQVTIKPIPAKGKERERVKIQSPTKPNRPLSGGVKFRVGEGSNNAVVAIPLEKSENKSMADPTTIKQAEIPKQKGAPWALSAGTNAAGDDVKNSMLRTASSRGETLQVERLLEKGADIQGVDVLGRTPLIMATLGAHTSVVELLLDQGAKADVADKQGWTALHHATINGLEKAMRILLDKGANIDIPTRREWTTLYYASSYYNQDRISSLLLNQESEKDLVNDDGMTSLHHAARKGKASTLRLLLHYGANKHLIDKKGMTALHHACSEGFEDITRVLLDKGAMIDVADGSGETPLHHASSKGRDEVVELLLKKGAKVDAIDVFRTTPLQCAVQSGHTNAARLLLANSADVNLANNYGKTALHYACLHGYELIVPMLLHQGAAIDQADKNGYTALHHASSTGREGTVQLLLHRGAQIDAVTVPGSTPLALAQGGHHNAVVKILRERASSDGKSGNKFSIARILGR